MLIFLSFFSTAYKKSFKISENLIYKPLRFYAFFDPNKKKAFTLLSPLKKYCLTLTSSLASYPREIFFTDFSPYSNRLPTPRERHVQLTTLI